MEYTRDKMRADNSRNYSDMKKRIASNIFRSHQKQYFNKGRDKC